MDGRTILGRLRILRKELARSACRRDCLIIPTATLIELAENRPRNEAELGRVRGLGNTKRAAYGRAILACITKESASPVMLAKEVAGPGLFKERLPRNAYNDWTEEEDKMLITRLEQGKSLAELAKELERTPRGIESRLITLGKVEEAPLHLEDWGTGVDRSDQLWERCEALKAGHSALRKLVSRVAQKNPALELRATEVSAETPDLLLQEKNGEWEVSVNPQTQITIEITAAGTSRETQTARWWARVIAAREETMVRVVRELILGNQRRFLQKGCTALVPCKMVKIAKGVGLHETTVSRALFNKSIQTPHGVLKLSAFFGSAIPTEAGGAINTEAAKELVAGLLKAEDPNRPWSDERLRNLLRERHGVVLARRTVAKYRYALGIAATPARKTRRAA